MKINFIVGIPCSGKSHFLDSLNNCLKIDDPKNIEDVFDLIEKTSYNDIYVADCNFCFSDTLENALFVLKSRFDFDYEILYFENNLEKATKLLELRNQNGDNRNVFSYMKYLSKIYNPPKIDFLIYEYNQN